MATSQQALTFPHYKPEEVEVAKTFLALGRLKGNWSFWIPLDTPQSQRLIEMEAHPNAIWLWQKQADAICETDKEIWIVEFKEKLRPSGIGQLLVYEDLYKYTYKPTKPIKLLMVARLDDPSIHPTMSRLGIRWELV